MRRVIAVLTLASALLGLGALPAVAGGPNNLVLSDATVDATGAATFDTHASMVTGATGTDEVTSTNIARAVAHDCTGCQAIAVAFQAVLVTGHPDVEAPRNVAYAANVRCTGCAAFAFSYKQVFPTGGPAHITPAGMEGIAALRQEVARDLATDLTPEDLDARLTDVGNRFKALVYGEIVRTGGTPHDGELDREVDRTPAPAPAPTPAPAPAERAPAGRPARARRPRGGAAPCRARDRSPPRRRGGSRRPGPRAARRAPRRS